jgi:DNA-binding transcriptional LysR family regulator
LLDADVRQCAMSDNTAVSDEIIALVAAIMDRLAAIGAFVGVAERGGFAAAARHLRLNPSAVTRAVQALEAELGVQLFMRSTRSVRLTDAGTRYLAHARRILGELDVAERDMRDTRAVPSGRITVTAPVQFGRLHVRPAVSRFLARFPEVRVRLRLDDAISSLVDEGIDVAIRIGNLADSSLVARRVGWTRRLLVASPAYLARRGTPATPEALLDHDIAGIASDVGHTEWQVGGVTLRLHPRFASDSIDAVLGHVLDGGGIAFLLSYQVTGSIASGQLVELLPDHAPDRVPIHLVHPPARLPGSATRALIDMVAGEARWDFGDR